jgi:hypothetical protein
MKWSMVSDESIFFDDREGNGDIFSTGELILRDAEEWVLLIRYLHRASH